MILRKLTQYLESNNDQFEDEYHAGILVLFELDKILKNQYIKLNLTDDMAYKAYLDNGYYDPVITRLADGDSRAVIQKVLNDKFTHQHDDSWSIVSMKVLYLLDKNTDRNLRQSPDFLVEEELASFFTLADASQSVILFEE